MAKYSEKRDDASTAKYLFKIWSRVDSDIQLPQNLTGSALLSRLEGIEPPSKSVRKIRFSPRVFTWQSGVTYAAAFALILALSVALSRGDTDSLIQGQITMAEHAEEAVEEEMALDAGAGAQMFSAGVSAEQNAPATTAPLEPAAAPNAADRKSVV